MFFCDLCARLNAWPASLATSYGNCEICGKPRVCNDVPSSLLPIPLPTPEKENPTDG